MKRSILSVTSVSLVLWSAACGSSRARPTSGGLGQQEVSVVIENENFYDATVYTCRDARRERLGVVTSSQTREFRFRWVSGDLRFLIDFTGGGSHITNPLYVETGEELNLVITTHMHRGGRRDPRCP